MARGDRPGWAVLGEGGADCHAQDRNDSEGKDDGEDDQRQSQVPDRPPMHSLPPRVSIPHDLDFVPHL